jgi:hypothetical protein
MSRSADGKCHRETNWPKGLNRNRNPAFKLLPCRNLQTERNPRQIALFGKVLAQSKVHAEQEGAL